MDNDNIISAIDIGTTKIVAIIGKLDANNKLEILGIGESLSHGVKRGAVINIESTVESLQKAINQAQEIADYKITEAYIGIASSHIKTKLQSTNIERENPEEDITEDEVFELEEKVNELRLSDGDKIIQIIPFKYKLDSEETFEKPVGINSRTLTGFYHTIIGQRSASNNIKKCIDRTDIQINKLILEPIASAEAVLTPDEKELGVALIDIGGGTSDLAIFYNGILQHSAVIPLGGKAITEDIKKGTQVLERQAEELKIKHGSALQEGAKENSEISIPGIAGREPKIISERFLAQIINARMSEILEFIKFEIEKSGLKNDLGAGVVITGGGASLSNVNQLAGLIFNTTVKTGLPNIAINKKDIDINNPRYSTSIGLLMQGYFDLQNNEKDEEEKSKSKNKKDGIFKNIYNNFLTNQEDPEFE